MIGKAVLIGYSIAVLGWCLSQILKSRDQHDSWLDWFFTITLPIAVAVGAIGFGFQIGGPMPFIYLPVWIVGFAATIWEFRGLDKLEGGYNVSNIAIGIVMMATIFGPGLFLGSLWIRSAFFPG